MRRLAAALAACTLLFAAGCSGTQPSASNSSLVGFVNAIPNGGTAIFFTGANVAAEEPFFGASPYFSTPITTPYFAFQLSGEPGTVYQNEIINITPAVYYSAIVMGRADVSATDPRYPQIKVIQDGKTPAPTGDIRLRIMNVAPDLSSMDVTANGTSEASAALYPSFGSYVNLAAGNLTITVNQTGGAQVASTEFTPISSGHLYTAYVVESDTTPTYAIELLDDTTGALVP